MFAKLLKKNVKYNEQKKENTCYIYINQYIKENTKESYKKMAVK